MGALEIFVGVNMLGMGGLGLFAGARLPGGFGDALVLLILSARNGGAERGAEQKSGGSGEQLGSAQNSPHACGTRLEGHRGFCVSQQHSKPTTGGLRVSKFYSNGGEADIFVFCGFLSVNRWRHRFYAGRKAYLA